MKVSEYVDELKASLKKAHRQRDELAHLNNVLRAEISRLRILVRFLGGPEQPRFDADLATGQRDELIAEAERLRAKVKRLKNAVRKQEPDHDEADRC